MNEVPSLDDRREDPADYLSEGELAFLRAEEMKNQLAMLGPILRRILRNPTGGDWVELRDDIFMIIIDGSFVLTPDEVEVVRKVMDS